MATGVIEINDAGISTYLDGHVDSIDAACAVLDGDTLLLGNDACAQTRLKPGWTNNRFWSKLDMDPLPNATSQIRHNADLAYAHMQQIWEKLSPRCDQTILAVPGTMQKAQMALLLGITRELSMPVGGLVDSAVVAASDVEVSDRLMHLDVQLHRIVLTTLDQGPRLQRASVVVIAETGLSQLQTRWANVISDAFVRSSRFDPMHGARSEQMLYDHLPTWLEQISVQSTSHLELEANGAIQSATVQKDQLINATADIYPKVVEQIRSRLRDEQCTLILSHRFGQFPGLDETLALLKNCDVVHLKAEAVGVGAIKHKEHISSTGDNVSFVTSIPWQSDGEKKVVGENLTPTHVVYKGRALPIGTEPLWIGVDVPSDQGINVSNLSKGISRKHCSIRKEGGDVRVDDHSSFGTYINELKVSETALLQAGDVLKLGDPGEELLLVSVVSG